MVEQLSDYEELSDFGEDTEPTGTETKEPSKAMTNGKYQPPPNFPLRTREQKMQQMKRILREQLQAYKEKGP